MSQTKAQLLDNIKDDVQLDARKSLRFSDADSSHYVAFKAPATVSSNVTWTLPAADGSANYVLATDGSGTLSWIADPAGQWVTTGSHVYFSAGNVGIGDNSPSNPLSVTGASAFNGDVQFTGANYNVIWDKSVDDLIFNDNAQACFGTGSDLKLYHNGTNDFIQSNGGYLKIQADSLKIHDRSDDHPMITAANDGEVALFFDNSEKLNTVTDGINLTGSLQFADDTNTHLARPAADVLAITTGGSERLRVDSAGRVGIGTTSPARTLHLSNADPRIRLTDTDAGDNVELQNVGGNCILKTDGSYHLQLYTNDTERFRIKNDGNVGIGTTSPNYLLDVEAASGDAQMRLQAADDSVGNDTFLRQQVAGTTQNNYIYFGDSADSNAGQIRYSHTNDFMSFTANAAERVRIDSDGRLLVGHNANDPAGGTTGGMVQIWGTRPLQCGRASADASGALVCLFKTRNATPGSHTIVQDDDDIGSIQFAADDGTDYATLAAHIEARVDGTPGANDMPGRLEFATTADGANSVTVRMKIDSAGRIGIGDAADSTPAAQSTRVTIVDDYDHGISGNDFQNKSHLKVRNDNAGISGTGPGGGNYSLGVISLEGTHSNGSVRGTKICGAEKLSVYVDNGEDGLNRPTILMDKHWLHMQAEGSNREFFVNVDTDDGDLPVLWLGNDGNRLAGSPATTMFDANGKQWMKGAIYLGRTRNEADNPTNTYENVQTGLYIYHGDSGDSSKYCQRLDASIYSGSDTGDYSILKWWTNSAGTGQVDTSNSDTNTDFKFNVKADGRIQSLGHWFTGRIEHNHASPQSAYSTTDNVVHAYSDNAEGRTTIQGFAEPASSNYAIIAETGTSTSDDDIQFKVKATDGRIYSDYGASVTHGADYAEYFEWKDGNPSDEDRVGKTVVLEDGKIRLATDSDDKSKIIGIISAAPAVVGDTGDLKWHGRWLKDDFGRDITDDVELLVWNHGRHSFQPEQSDTFHLNKCDSSIRVSRIEAGLKDGRVPQWAVDQNLRVMAKDRKKNPAYDPKKGYISREDRKEWDPVGLVGKLYVYKDQPKGTNWIKLSDKTSTIERWLVR